MSGFVDAIQLHTPTSVGAAALLVVSLLIGFFAFRAALGVGTATLATMAAVGAFVQVGHPSIPMAVAAAGALLAWRARTLALAVGTASFARELAIVLGGWTAYELARFTVVSEREKALENADRVVSLERSLGLFWEPDMQRWFTATEWTSHWLGQFYSHGFLAVIVGTILWLHFADPARYKLYRNALGISTVLAVILIASLPTAPPRLTPGLGVEDTVVALGREHRFANEYAAIPSLHVGWFALTGYVLALRYRGWRFWGICLLPGTGMLVTVIATGNHFWVDGAIGAAVAVGPALVLRHRAGLTAAWAELLARIQCLTPAARWRIRLATLALGGLILYLGWAQAVSPGFTDFWAYLFFQMIAMVVVLIGGEIWLAREGGLSSVTHVMAIFNAYADVLGTDGNLYARIDEYDKLTHFLGTAAITAGVYDLLRAVGFGRNSLRGPTNRLYLAMAAGIAVGISWEVYELLGDRVFHTARVQGQWDTANDLLSDSAGAVVIAYLMWFRERTVPATATAD